MKMMPNYTQDSWNMRSGMRLFGITESIGAALIAAGVGETTASILAPAILGSVTGAGSSAITGGNIGKGALLGGVTGGIGGGIGAAGGLSGIGDSIGGVFGDASLGSDIGAGLSNFTDSTGLSQLFGGTSAPSDDLNSAYNAIDTTSPNLQATAGATAPVDFAPGGASASYTAGAAAPGSAGVGGGSLTGFSGDGSSIGEGSALGSAQGGAQTGAFNYDLSGNASTPSELGAGGGIGAQQASPLQSLFSSANSPSTGGFNYDISGSPAGTSSYSPTQQLANAAAPSAGGNSVSGLSSLFSGSSGSPLNGILKGGLGYLLNNDNASGNKAITNASNAAQANFAPYLQAGTGAENTLSSLYGNNGTAAQASAQQGFQNSPGYQFALNQGLNAINADAAAKGQTLSGNTMQGINNYAQGTASQQYNNYINQLQNLASGGLSAAGGSGTAGLTGAGAQAQTGQNRANAKNTAIGTGLSSLFPSQLNLQQLLGTGGAGGSGGLLAALGLS